MSGFGHPFEGEKLRDFLMERLKRPLPGFAAQRKMGPRLPDGRLTHDRKPPPDCRYNGIMLLFFPSGDDHRLLLTVRSDRMPNHKGEISCPGGGILPHETPIEAALRETQEETGVNPDGIDVIGMMSDLYIPVSGNILKPVVGFLPSSPETKPDPREVSRILTPGLSEILDGRNIREETWKLRGYEIIVPFWDIDRIPLWGATAMVLSELREILLEKASQ